MTSTATPGAAPSSNLATAAPPVGKPVGDAASLLGEPAAQRWYARRTVWLCVAAFLLSAGGWWWWHVRALAQAAPRYVTATVARGNLTLTVSANGTIQPTRSINIGSELSGTVLEVRVDVNDIVKKGQVMVVLDSAKLRDQILRSSATLAASNARVAQTVATLAEARASMAKLDDVARASGGRVPAKTELDSGRATLARAVADDASARAMVNDSEAALAVDQINLSKASIAAPADGMVLTRTVDPGNAVAASLQAVTLFTLAEDLAKLRVWIYVDEADVGSVKKGQEATFTVSAYPARKFPAKVTRVGFGSTITDSVVTYLTYMDVSNDDMSLRPGMTASANIVALQRTNVLLVPNTALRFTPSAADTGAKKGLASGVTFGPPKTESKRKGAADSASTANARRVWVLPGDGKDTSATPLEVAVVPGISDGHMTEIIGGDLKADMQVITGQKTSAAR